jgi:hypothetical protein
LPVSQWAPAVPVLSKTMTMKAVAVTVWPLGLPLAVSDGAGPEFPEPAGGWRSAHFAMDAVDVVGPSSVVGY